MKLRISDIIQDSIVDGKGIRLTVFTQGCPHNCPQCHNPQTHSFEAGKEMDTNMIIQLMKENPLLDGITLSGGEPFVQAKGCAEIARDVHKNHLNVWTYTGYTYEQILNSKKKDWLDLLYETDVLVDGQFLAEKRSIELSFRGSSNQRIIDVQKSLKEKKVVLIQ